MNAQPTLQITTRGRVVLGALIAIPVLTISMFLASSAASAGSEPTDDPFEYVAVLSGDTLWSLAEMIAPEQDPRDVVAEIMSLNGLTSASLTPGQELAIPR